MEKRPDARIGVVFISLVLILSIFAFMLLNDSTAWFADNKTVQGYGFDLSVNNAVGVEAGIKSYPITEINEQTGEYTIDRNAESYVLPTDDPNGISYSKYKKALAVIITIEANSDSGAVVGIFLNAASPVETIINPGLSNYISNCISITPATLSADGKIATKKEATEEDEVVSQTFVDLSKTPVAKSSVLNIGKNISVEKGKPVDLCFIIEYDSGLLFYIAERILSQNLAENKITYYDDLRFDIHK